MLPIVEIRDELLSALRKGNRVILRAPTGSGKSTRVPAMILDDGGVEGEITVLQPRRLAARMLARRVAAERGGSVGGEVGYQVRLERKAGAGTRIRYVTEGILLREWLRDPGLSRVGCVVFDEFHERHLYGDLTLAHALRLQETVRPDLKLVVMSATLDTGPLRAFLPDAEVVTSEGRTWPVDLHYLDRDPQAARTRIWDSAATAAERLAERTQGDLLVFMPGRFEIDRTLEALKRTSLGKTADVLPLHGQLSAEAQDRAVAPGARRRVIVATNIAETSLTLEGVTGVVDSGLARVARMDPVRKLDRLDIEPVSKASADQRAGRAGRVAPGVCVRLWTEAGQARRPARETPEIHRVDLAEAVLMFRALGVRDWTELRLPDPPEAGPLALAETLLTRLGALDREGAITELGRRMLEVPAHPRIGRLLVEAEARGVVESAARMAAILQGRPLFPHAVGESVRARRRDAFGGDGTSDLIARLRALDWAESVRFDRRECEHLGVHAQAARQALRTVSVFRRGASGGDSGDEEALRNCIALAFADQLGRRRPDTRRCDLVDGQVAELDRDSVCGSAEFLVAAEVRDSERLKTPVLGGATRVEPEWLDALWPEGVEVREEARYDRFEKRVVAERREVMGELVLSETRSHEVDDEVAARLLMEQVEAGEVPMPGWNREVEDWITRMNCLAAWRPDWEIPPLKEEDRRVLMEHMLGSCRTRKDVKNLDVRRAVEDWLPPMQRALVEEYAPRRVKLPCGRNAKIRYEEGAPPVVSSKLQDFFGMTESPGVAGGAARCRVELLAPNGRPAAVTDDLARFWKEGYPRVRKELRGRYPKHAWPETP